MREENDVDRPCGNTRHLHASLQQASIGVKNAQLTAQFTTDRCPSINSETLPTNICNRYVHSTPYRRSAAVRAPHGCQVLVHRDILKRDREQIERPIRQEEIADIAPFKAQKVRPRRAGVQDGTECKDETCEGDGNKGHGGWKWRWCGRAFETDVGYESKSLSNEFRHDICSKDPNDDLFNITLFRHSSHRLTSKLVCERR